jgi:hypothetical protein
MEDDRMTRKSKTGYSLKTSQRLIKNFTQRPRKRSTVQAANKEKKANNETSERVSPQQAITLQNSSPTSSITALITLDWLRACGKTARVIDFFTRTRRVDQTSVLPMEFTSESLGD